MKQVNINFRIPLSIKDIKLLWKEKTDKNFRSRREAYWKLKNAVVKEASRWGKSCDLEYVKSHFETWISEYFHEWVDEVLLGEEETNKKKRKEAGL
jgi:hypothetical protein